MLKIKCGIVERNNKRKSQINVPIQNKSYKKNALMHSCKMKVSQERIAIIVTHYLLH